MKISFAFFILISTALASPLKMEDTALSMVPRGRMVERTTRDFTVKTKAGTKVMIEFSRGGKFQEAQGLNLNQGDEFEPGMGLRSLSSTARAVAALGHDVKGRWNLEKDEKLGWVYELAGQKDGEDVYHLINAASGEILNMNVAVQEVVPPAPSP